MKPNFLRFLKKQITASPAYVPQIPYWLYIKPCEGMKVATLNIISVVQHKNEAVQIFGFMQ